MLETTSFGLFRAACKLFRVDKELIDRVVAELNSSLVETRFRSITQIGKYRYVVTFEGETSRRLLISIEPRDPRIYLIRRRDRELKKAAAHRSLFAIAAERALAGSMYVSAETLPSERIVKLAFKNETFVIQLTGASSNLFVLGSEDTILHADRTSTVAGQTVGSVYLVPAERHSTETSAKVYLFEISEGPISDLLDAHFSQIDEASEFHKLAELARTRNRQQIQKTEKLIRNLEKDLVEHGNAEGWKRFGDLLLASQGTAELFPNEIEVTDFFDETQPRIRIAADDNDSIPETAQKYFRRYAKARNAKNEVEARIERARKEVLRLERVGVDIEKAIERSDSEQLVQLTDSKPRATPPRPKTKEEKQISGIRKYLSSDGFEILVGKKAIDNDFLTLRVAHSRDTWMHAADYPGSHVVVRNANRQVIPQRTLIEAAQLAAFFSQGNKQTKAAVNYTEKKFVSKPKGAAPGLVRLASFKTLLVEPLFPEVEKRDA